jgi:hypothetical protein
MAKWFYQNEVINGSDQRRGVNFVTEFSNIPGVGELRIVDPLGGQ